MGIFSSKYKTVVGTSISKLADAKEFVSATEKGVISGLSRNESLSEHIMENLVTGPGFRAKSAHNYAGGSYTFGRPNDTLFAKNGSTAAVNTAINNYLVFLYGSGIDLYYTRYGSLNYYHKFYDILLTSYGYKFSDPELTVLTASKGFTVNLYSAELLVNPTNNDELEDSFIELSPLGGTFIASISSFDVTKIGARFTYRWTDTTVNPPLFVSRSDPPNIVGSTVTIINRGPIDFVNVLSSSSGPSTPYTTTHVETLPASPPAIYGPITRTTVETGNYVVTTSVIEYYTASTTTLVTTTEEVVSYTGNSVLTIVTPKQETEVISYSFEFSTVDLSQTYCLAFYRTSGGTLGTFTYLFNSGTIPSIDGLFNTTYTSPGNYMPRLYCRWEFQRGDIDKASTAYKHSKKMARRMGINYDDLVDAVHKIDDDRTQADLDLVRSGFIGYMVQADSTSQVELYYLYEHFKDWFGVIGGITTSTPLTTFNSTIQMTDMFEHVLVIEDARFKTTIGMQGIWKRTVTGVVAPVGKYHSVVGEITITSGGGGAFDDYRPTFINTFPYHCYRYQDTATTYIEYQIIGLETKYYVTGDHYSASGYTADVEDTKDILYVPINYEIVKQMKIFDQEEFMYNAIHFVANSFQVIKVKWYQRNGWGTLFKIVALVAIIYGFYQGIKLISALITIATVSAVWALELAIGYLIQYLQAMLAVKLFVAAAGEELAFLVAIVAAVYGMSGGSVFGYTAKDLLSAGNALFQGVTDSLGKKMAGLQADFDTLEKEFEGKFDELERIEEEMYNPNTKFTSLLVGEKPDTFYNRTVHNGNPGTKIFDLLENHVAMALRLPTINDTLEV